MSIIGPNSSFNSTRLVNQHHRANDRTAKALERLSTGKRINRPSDDPSGFVAVEQLRGELIDLQAEGRAAGFRRVGAAGRTSGLGEVQRALNDLRGAVTTAANSINSRAEVAALQGEVEASLDAIDLVDSYTAGLPDDASLEALRGSGAANVLDGDAGLAAKVVDAQQGAVAQAAAAAGAASRTDQALDELRQDRIVITTETISQIEDADFAEESVNLAAGRVLSQASAAALAYSSRQQAEQIDELIARLDVQVG